MKVKMATLFEVTLESGQIIIMNPFEHALFPLTNPDEKIASIKSIETEEVWLK